MTWPELVPFDDSDARDVPDFPLEVLPPALGKFAATIAGNLLTPIDLPAVATLGAASAAVAGRVRLRVSADWCEPANMYLGAVLPPSLHKSPTLKLVTEPFETEETALVERWRGTERERDAARDEIKRELAHLGRKKPTPEINAKIRELKDRSMELAAAARPELLSDDATSEALIRKLQHGPIFVASAEGRPFELMSGLYRRPGEDGADVYLKAWSEDPIRSSRVTSGDVFVPRPNLTLFLAVQPTVVAKLASREDFRGRGVHPASSGPTRGRVWGPETGKRRSRSIRSRSSTTTTRSRACSRSRGRSRGDLPARSCGSAAMLSRSSSPTARSSRPRSERALPYGTGRIPVAREPGTALAWPSCST
jgi:hypothetical protein